MTKLGQIQRYWFLLPALYPLTCKFVKLTALQAISKSFTRCLHISDIARRSRQCKRKARRERFWSPDSSWLLPCHCTLCFLYPYCGVLPRHHKRTCVKAGSFQKRTKAYAWHMRRWLQTYLNTSVMMGISHPTVIYLLTLFGPSVFGAGDEEKTTRLVYAWIIEEHWASCQYVKFYPRMKHCIFLTWLSNHIT